MKTIKINNSPLELEEREKELQEEFAMSIEFWNKASDDIKRIEKFLQESFPNVPFTTPHPIHMEIEFLKNLIDFNVDGSLKTINWFLAWDKYDQSNKFRLLLIKKEKETIIYDNQKEPLDLPTKCILKKPLIEVDIKSRLKCYQNLDRFVFLFKKHLEELRITELTEDDLNFKNI